MPKNELFLGKCISDFNEYVFHYLDGSSVSASLIAALSPQAANIQAAETLGF